MFRKEMFTAFSDILIKDLKQLFETQHEPILILSDMQHILGLIEPNHFWKQLALNSELKSIEQLISHSYQIYDDLEEITYDDTHEYTYGIINRNHQFYLYNMNDVREQKIKNELDHLKNRNNSLLKEYQKANDLNRELKQILNSSYDEIFVTDAEGNTLFVSESVKKLLGFPPEAYIGKNVKELVKTGLIVNSTTLKTMETKKIESAEQIYPTGITVFATSKPIFDNEGNLFRIVTNSRDISELVEMKQKLKKMENEQLYNEQKSTINKVFYYNGLITASKKMLSIIDTVKKVAKTDASILINGESGVGKGVLARIIHNLSNRRHNRFIQVNCGSIPPTLIESELFGYESGAFTGATKKGKKGLVELANGGTLFLDEIGEMPKEMQVKLLQLVQEKTFIKIGGTKEKQVDIRIISATNKDLKKMITENTFREDLYYRLHVVPLYIPPLRERKDDILILIDYFLYKFNKKHNQSVTLDKNARLFLQLHDYPGNIRELENLIEQIVVTTNDSIVSIDELPFHFNKIEKSNDSSHKEIQPLKKLVEKTEKQALIRALEKYNTTRQLADALQVSQTTIVRKLKKYNLSTK